MDELGGYISKVASARRPEVSAYGSKGKSAALRNKKMALQRRELEVAAGTTSAGDLRDLLRGQVIYEKALGQHSVQSFWLELCQHQLTQRNL